MISESFIIIKLGLTANKKKQRFQFAKHQISEVHVSKIASFYCVKRRNRACYVQNPDIVLFRSCPTFYIKLSLFWKRIYDSCLTHKSIPTFYCLLLFRLFFFSLENLKRTLSIHKRTLSLEFDCSAKTSLSSGSQCSQCVPKLHVKFVFISSCGRKVFFSRMKVRLRLCVVED